GRGVPGHVRQLRGPGRRLHRSGAAEGRRGPVMTTWPVRRDEGRESALAAFGERLRSPVAPYYLLLGSTALLVARGLVMVLSASSISSYQNSGTSFEVFLTPLMYAGAGIVLAYVCSRIPVRVWKWLAPWGMLAAIGLQALVFSPLGVLYQGNRNWISILGFSVQPSEFGKLALVVFGAT